MVPKDGGRKTRLIFHLSYPRNTGRSVNANTPEELAKVNYKSFDDAVKICIKVGKGKVVYLGKSDLSNAFRNLPINKKFWKYLVMKAQSPIDGKWYYFVDKCLPFGASISCKIFQEFSDALSHIIKFLSDRENVNYLDDFLFIDEMKKWCDRQLEQFLQVCDEIRFPVSLEKTEWGNTVITFLGLLINAEKQRIEIPADKINRAVRLIETMLPKEKSNFERYSATLWLSQFPKQMHCSGKSVHQTDVRIRCAS